MISSFIQAFNLRHRASATFYFSVRPRLQPWITGFFSLMLPCVAVCDLSHNWREDATCQKNPITPFVFFYRPTGSATRLHKIYVLPFNFFFFFFSSSSSGKYTITHSLFFSKGYNMRTLLCMDTASHISRPFFFCVETFL